MHPLLVLLSTLHVAGERPAQPGRCFGSDVMRYITTIAADSMSGRAPGSRGDSLTTAFLYRALEEAVGERGVVSTQAVPLRGDSSLTSRNVIATIPGERREWVVMTAHHDGLGVGKPDVRGDSIYNGANDNALGVALALCVARSLAPPRGRRGVIVILTAAEESGHIGSRYWAEHPTVELAKVKFVVNLDALGVTGPTQDFIAYGNGMLIGADSMLRAAGQRAGFELTTASFESNMYWAFDSAELAAVGVPSVTVSQGMRRPSTPSRALPEGMPTMRQRYHAPSDEVVEDWDTAAILRYGELSAAVVEGARAHVGEIRLRVANVYRVRPE